MHQEAFAYAKYILFAEHRRQSAILSWHKLLEQAAREVLREHFTEEAGLAGFVSSDAENLEDAVMRWCWPQKQQAGKIRAIGVSSYSIEAMEQFRRVAPLASAQPPLNLFERQAQRGILPWYRENAVATLAYGALCRGLLSGAVNQNTKLKGDDLRKTDPKFQPPRFEHHLKAVNLLERYARERYGKVCLSWRFAGCLIS